jgi:hypothetical protein
LHRPDRTQNPNITLSVRNREEGARRFLEGGNPIVSATHADTGAAVGLCLPAAVETTRNASESASCLRWPNHHRGSARMAGGVVHVFLRHLTRASCTYSRVTQHDASNPPVTRGRESVSVLSLPSPLPASARTRHSTEPGETFVRWHVRPNRACLVASRFIRTFFDLQPFSMREGSVGNDSYSTN